LKRTRQSTTRSKKYKPAGPGPRIVIFTDLDGTLLSAETYEPGPSLESLRQCRKLQIPVIFVSSKTRAEMERLRKELDNSDPFVSENGGGVFLPRETWEKPQGFVEGGNYWSLWIGVPHAAILKALDAAVKRCSARIERFSSMSIDRIMERTGLSPDEARLARMREFDEPFLIPDQSDKIITGLEQEIRKAGFNLTRGGRFYHVMGGCDKGKAVRRIMDLYRGLNPDVCFAAVGDAENDLPMLLEADLPFLVRKPDGEYDKAAVLNRVIITQGIGPQGFYEAVRNIITNS